MSDEEDFCVYCGDPYANLPVETNSGTRYVHPRCYTNYARQILRRPLQIQGGQTAPADYEHPPPD